MKVIAIIVAVTIVALVAFAAVDHMINAPTVTAISSSIVDENALTATISGEINRPGTYVLSEGAKLIDLITAASGTTSNADTLAFNTDFVLQKKGSYYIAPIYDNGNTCAVTPIVKANINKASQEDLISIAGFGKAAASALVSYRASTTFYAIEEIKNVSGIGDATYISVRDKITLRDAGA